jgi:hypothetical protein
MANITEFYRLNNEKCQHFKVKELKDSNIPIEAKHGDMIVGPVKNLRSMEVYFVTITTKGDKQLIQQDTTSSGYCSVPLKITQFIENPISFYNDAFNYDQWSETDFLGFEIDAKKHKNAISQYTNGRIVNENRKLFYFVSDNEWDIETGLFIWCDFFVDNKDEEDGEYIRITQTTPPDDYLIDKPEPCYNASRIEYKIKKYLKQVENGDKIVEIFKSELFLNESKTNDSEISMKMTMTLESIEWNNDCGDKQSIKAVNLIHNHNKYKFIEKVLFKKGLYRHISLLCNDHIEKDKTFIIFYKSLFY